MNAEIKVKSIDAAKFWYESSLFFESICLLAEAISNQLSASGYKPLFHSYGLKFAASDPGGTRLVYDRVKNHWFGEFSIGDHVEQHEITTYGFGIAFGINDPESSVSPWFPIVYFFKSKIVENAKWKSWEYPQKLFSPINLMILMEETEKYIINVNVDDYDDIDYAKVIVFPLGTICSTDDVAKITKPCVEALRSDDENQLKPIEEYLFLSNKGRQT